jgi:hypothetical protein
MFRAPLSRGLSVFLVSYIHLSYFRNYIGLLSVNIFLVAMMDFISLIWIDTFAYSPMFRQRTVVLKI